MDEIFWTDEQYRLQKGRLSESELASLLDELTIQLDQCLQSLNFDDVLVRLRQEGLQASLEAYLKTLLTIAERVNLVAQTLKPWDEQSLVQRKYITGFNQLYSKSVDALAPHKWLVQAQTMWHAIRMKQDFLGSIGPWPEDLDERISKALNSKSSDEVMKVVVELSRIERSLEDIQSDSLMWIFKCNGFEQEFHGDESVKKDRRLQNDEYHKMKNESTRLLELLKSSDYMPKLDFRYCELKVQETDDTKEALNDLLCFYKPSIKLADLPHPNPFEVQVRRAKLIVAFCEEALKKFQ